MRDRTGRATPLAPSERQAAIIEAVTPLLVERGSSVTSKDLAAAAGVAEGTLFRAFGSKNGLLHAVMREYISPAKLAESVAAFPADSGLEETVEHIAGMMIHGLTGLGRIASALEHSADHGRGHGPGRHHGHESQREGLLVIDGAIEEAFAPHAAEMSVPPATAAAFLRGVCVGAAFTPDAPIPVSDITTVVLHGVVGARSAKT